MSVRIEAIKPHVGGIVHVDKAKLCEPEVIEAILDAMEARSVLVFPRIGLDDEEQLAFTDALGARVNFTQTVPGGGVKSDVYQVTLDEDINDQPEYVMGTFFWHMDGLISEIPPPKASVLSARRTAPKGGQTQFASTSAGYRALPESEKADLDGLRAVHSVPAAVRMITDSPTPEELARWNAAPIKDHPIVWKRKSGVSSMLIGTSADRVEGMTLPEGRALLVRLVEWCAQPDFLYSHQWEEGDLVVWDNCGALHRVIPYDKTSGRMMHRTSVGGSEATQ